MAGGAGRRAGCNCFDRAHGQLRSRRRVVRRKIPARNPDRAGAGTGPAKCATPERLARKSRGRRGKNRLQHRGSASLFRSAQGIARGRNRVDPGRSRRGGSRPGHDASFRARSAIAERAFRAGVGRAGPDLSALHRALRLPPLRHHRARADPPGEHGRSRERHRERRRPMVCDSRRDRGLSLGPMVRLHSNLRAMNNGEFPRFYFALPRLLALFRGGISERAENNGGEAWIASTAVYLVSYLYFAQFIPATFGLWLKILSLVLLAFLVWLFWLLALYVNSLVIKLLQACGLFRKIPVRRAQRILVAGAASAMAFQLLQAGGWQGEIAAIWLVAVAMNLAAAVILALRNGDRAHS